MTDDRILELLKLNDHATSGNGLALAFGLAIANEAASEEREACAKICDALAEEAWKRWKEMYHPHDEGLSDGAAACATDIRARSNAIVQAPPLAAVACNAGLAGFEYKRRKK